MSLVSNAPKMFVRRPNSAELNSHSRAKTRNDSMSVPPLRTNGAYSAKTVAPDRNPVPDFGRGAVSAVSAPEQIL